LNDYANDNAKFVMKIIALTTGID